MDFKNCVIQFSCSHELLGRISDKSGLQMQLEPPYKNQQSNQINQVGLIQMERLKNNCL